MYLSDVGEVDGLKKLVKKAKKVVKKVASKGLAVVGGAVGTVVGGPAGAAVGAQLGKSLQKKINKKKKGKSPATTLPADVSEPVPAIQGDTRKRVKTAPKLQTSATGPTPIYQPDAPSYMPEMFAPAPASSSPGNVVDSDSSTGEPQPAGNNGLLIAGGLGLAALLFMGMKRKGR